MDCFQQGSNEEHALGRYGGARSGPQGFCAKQHG